MTARAHDCEDILKLVYRPGSDADSLELIQLEMYLMESVLNRCILSDMGKTTRKHLDSMNAQLVQHEFETHMTTSSKGNQKRGGSIPMLPPLYWIDLGRALLNSLSSISMNNSGNWKMFPSL